LTRRNTSNLHPRCRIRCDLDNALARIPEKDEVHRRETQ